jgi:gamma-glutamylcyclotransferase (GGCT)/AIG2-like uncharacterized protein YtfP
MAMQPVGVFAYGTLKQGQRNFYVSQQGGWLRSEPAWLEGFQMYALPRSKERLYPFPALIQGEGRVWGEVQYFADLEQALILLDELEEEGKEYLRLGVQARLEKQDSEDLRLSVWVYVYMHPASLDAIGAVWLPEGTWLGGR